MAEEILNDCKKSARKTVCTYIVYNRTRDPCPSAALCLEATNDEPLGAHEQQQQQPQDCTNIKKVSKGKWEAATRQTGERC